MNLTSTLLTCFKYFQPVYLLGNKACIPRSAYFILTNKCSHTHERGSRQLWKAVLKGVPFEICHSSGYTLSGFKYALAGNMR